MGAGVTIWTYDWVPEMPRGYVRDLRLRWACAEADISYDVRTIPFDGRETNHLDRQPFGQVPMLADGDVQIFESGACLIHLARKSEVLMPRDAVAQAEVLQWIIAALNSIEMVTMPWLVLAWSGHDIPAITDWMDKRLSQVEAVLANREWLVGDRFTAADLLMADVLRVAVIRKHGHRPASEAYVSRITSRPAFKKVFKEQVAQFEASDAARPNETTA